MPYSKILSMIGLVQACVCSFARDVYECLAVAQARKHADARFPKFCLVKTKLWKFHWCHSAFGTCTVIFLSCVSVIFLKDNTSNTCAHSLLVYFVPTSCNWSADHSVFSERFRSRCGWVGPPKFWGTIFFKLPAPFSLPPWGVIGCAQRTEEA